MIIVISLTDIDYGPMAVHETNAREHDDLFTTPGRPYANMAAVDNVGRGSVIDLVLPILALIGCCVIGMIYTMAASLTELILLLHFPTVMPLRVLLWEAFSDWYLPLFFT